MKARPRLSLVVIARDEADTIIACLESASGVDEVIVVDHGSQDATASVARAAGATVVVGTGTLGALRKAGQEASTCPWVLMLDADERLPPGGLARLRRALEDAPPKVSAFALAFRNHLGSRWLRWGGYSPARRVRLYRRHAGSWDEAARVHERVRLRIGRVSSLPGLSIEHHTYRDLSHARQKLERYATLSAAMLRDRGVRPSRVSSLLRVVWRGLTVFLFRGGFMMGRVGLELALLQARAVWQRDALARRPSVPTFER